MIPAIIAGVTTAVSSISKLLDGGGSGYVDLKSSLSDIANQTEAALRSNLNAYQAGQLSASQATERGWQLFNAMIAHFLNNGSTGQKSAAERDRRINAGSGLRWDWIATYLDPIPGSSQTTAAQTIPTSSTLSTGLNGQLYSSGLQTSDTNMLLLAAGAVVLIYVMKAKK